MPGTERTLTLREENIAVDGRYNKWINKKKLSVQMAELFLIQKDHKSH